MKLETFLGALDTVLVTALEKESLAARLCCNLVGVANLT